MIAYGRRKSEKIEGTRNEFHRVLRDGYDLFEGKHDALVTDETWQAVRRKRSEYADNHAPRYGPKNVHILSGLIRCPECGSPYKSSSASSSAILPSSFVFWRSSFFRAACERLIVHALVDNIEIHPKALPSGLVLKKIRFKRPDRL